MKKVFLVTFLLLISFINSLGQWYVKRYQVTDINLLTRGQLEESLVHSKTGLKLAAGFAGTGGAIFLICKYLHPGMSDDPSWIEQLLGDEGVDDVGMIIGAGTFIAGSIASIVCLGRIGTIKSVISRNYPSFGSVNISPAIILNRFTRSYCSGFSLTYSL